MTQSALADIKKKTFVLIGEVHGVRENLDVLRRLIRVKLQDSRTLLVALEWPKAIEKEVNRYLINSTDKLAWQGWDFIKYRDGRFSKEALVFLAWLKKMNSRLQTDKKIHLICFDALSKNWNTRDKKMAKNLMFGVEKKKQAVLAVMGNLHSKNTLFSMDKNSTKKYLPLGSYLPKPQTISIKLVYQSGTFYNLGHKEFDITKDSAKLKNFEIKKAEKQSGHSYILHIKKAHSVEPI